MTAPPGGAGPAPNPESVPAELEFRRVLVRNTVLNFLGRAVYIGGWLLVAPFMLERLGAVRFGFWSLLSVIAGLFSTFDLGLGQSLTKFVAEFHASGDRRSQRAIFTMGLALYGGLALLWIAAIALGREVLLEFFHISVVDRPEMRWALVAAAISFGVTSVFTLFGSVLAGLHRLDRWNQITIGVTLLQLAGTWLLLHFGGGLRELVLNAGVTTLIGTAIAWMIIRRVEPAIGLDPRACSRALGGRLTHYGAALQVVNIGILVQFQVPKVFLGRMISLAAVSSYELGARVAFAAWSLPTLFAPPLFPAISHLDAAGERPRLLRLYRRAARYVVTLAFILSAALMALSGPLFAAWLGPGHAQAASAAFALAVLLGINILTTPGSIVVRATGQPWMEARYHIVAMALHVILAIVLIPRFGFQGALMALVLSGALGTFYFLRAFHRFLGEPLLGFAREVLAWPLLAAAAGGGLAWWASGAIGADASTWTRARALVAVLRGGLAFMIPTVGILFASRYLSMSEVHEIVQLMVRRGRPEAGFDRE
jgi:O-antigen/teichoic acid export membrane protein